MQTAKAMRRTAKMDHCTTPKTRTNTHMFCACFLTTEVRMKMKGQLFIIYCFIFIFILLGAMMVGAVLSVGTVKSTTSLRSELMSTPVVQTSASLLWSTPTHPDQDPLPRGSPPPPSVGRVSTFRFTFLAI